jgi:diketogulonate reductase-like aldo/keto reductase
MQSFITSASGLHIPKLLYGTAWKKSETALLVELAIKTGFRGIDTACQPKHYDEAGVGTGIAACLNTGLTRSDLYLQTKFTSVGGQDPQRVPYDVSAPLPTQVMQSFAVSLRNLQTDYLDCLILHSPMPTRDLTLIVWRAFESLADTGGIRQLGISNCYDLADLEHLYQQVRIKPAVVQNRFFADTGYDREIRAFCAEHQIIYQSFWTLTANPDILAHPTIATLGLRYHRTGPQILFRYLTQAGVVPLTGTKSAKHMREDLSIFEFELNDAELDAIDKLL